MKILFHKKFRRFVKRIKNFDLVGIIRGEVDAIVSKPTRGKVLDHPFRKYKIRSVSFDYRNNSYRIAYIAKRGELIFLLIDSRENFYKKLERVT